MMGEMNFARLERGIGDPADVDELQPPAVAVMAPTGGVRAVDEELRVLVPVTAASCWRPVVPTGFSVRQLAEPWSATHCGFTTPFAVSRMIRWPTWASSPWPSVPEDA
jgi:hypothetical protein